MTEAPAPERSSISPRATGRTLDRLAELEEERRHLLRSLRDLEREFEAGDVDDDDYRTLRDDYTVRAADVLRDIEQGQRRLAPKPPRNWRRTIVTAISLLVLAVGIAWMLAQAWGERGRGQEITGMTPGSEVRELLTNARSQLFTNLPRSNELFLRAVELEEERGVDNPEPLTYYAWTLALGTINSPDEELADSTQEVALLALDRAIRMDPDYPDPHCFVGIIQFRFRDDAAAAEPFVDTCLEQNPPADVATLVEPLRDQIAAELAS
ncbi:MAG: hypothetical protein AAGG08_05075 [Actinomycetota bacterium]